MPEPLSTNTPDLLTPVSPFNFPAIVSEFYTVEENGNNWALFSKDMVYRFFLNRKTGIPGNKKLIWLMLNPSTADAFKLDPTVTRCLYRSKRYGANEMIILNLFAMRSPYPKDLYKNNNPIGLGNDQFIHDFTNRPDTTVVCAWGNHPKVKGRMEDVLELIGPKVPLKCLGTTKDGYPFHPLHIAYDQDLIDFQR